MTYFDHQTVLGIAERATRLGLTGQRDALLSGLHPAYLASLQGGGNATAQLMMDLATMNRTPAIEGGVIPLEQWLRSAGFMLSGRPNEQQFFRDLANDVARKSDLDSSARAGGAVIAAAIGTAIQEKIIFVNDLVPYGFLSGAERTGASVVRLVVPSHLAGVPRAAPMSGRPLKYFGTGWLIGPKHIITNHHVIEARSPGEASASDSDLAVQARKAVVQFDYDSQDSAGEKVEGGALKASNQTLDYAVLELAEISSRKPLRLFGGAMNLPADACLPVNIIQHPGGGPKQVAIRNNLAAKLTDDNLAYYTDTEGGSSGSPVANDDWCVVALHKATTPKFGKQVFQGKDTAWLNIGTRIDRIIDDLKSNHANLWIAIGATVVK